MLLIVFIFILSLLVFFTKNYFLFFITGLDVLNRKHLKITFYSFLLVVLYVFFLLYCFARNVNRLGKKMDLKKMYEGLTNSLVEYTKGYLTDITIYNTDITYIFIIFIIIIILINFFLSGILLIKYIKLSLKRIHFLLLNRAKYRYYRVLLNLLCHKILRSDNLYIVVNMKKKIIELYPSMFLLFCLKVIPVIYLAFCIYYDIYSNNFVIERYFYVCCSLPIYYFFLGILDFLTESGVNRIDDTIVYAALYCKHSILITEECKKELEKYKYVNNLTDLAGSILLKEKQPGVLTVEEFFAYEKFRQIEETYLNNIK